MRVLLIDVNCKKSSTGQIVYNIYSYLRSQGEEAAICYGRGEKITEENIYKFGLDWETYFHALLTRVSGYTGCFSFFSTKRLIKYIDRYKPDVVHIHELHAYFVNIRKLLKYLSEKGIRVVHTLHCEFSFTGKCGHSVECTKWKTECEKCPHLKDYPSSLFFDHTKHMFRVKKKWFAKLKRPTYVVPSNWLYTRMCESFFKDSEIVVIHNSIDTKVFSYKNDLNFENKDYIAKYTRKVLAVAPGLMSENKGGAFILSLATKMKDVCFILIGSDEEPYVRDNIVSLGKIYDKDKLAQFYSFADAFVICSRNENFPTTCIEAVCCGTRVVGFDAGGAKEVAPGNLGSFVKYGDLDALENEIRQVINDDNSKYLGEFKKIREHYSNERMCKDYYGIYTRKG